MGRKVSRLRSANPDHGRSGVRRWLTYLTLYATAIIFLSDLGFLLYIFLKGELTSRVFLKALAIAGISALIFWRYLAEMRGDEAPAREQRSEARRVGKECVIRVDLGGGRIIKKK